jgi:CO/xanthine dehydrogenase FAD-binding subunit
MIIEYHRPKSIEEALNLLGRSDPLTAPLGGGTYLNRPVMQEVAAVDLQALGLDNLDRRGNMLDVGAMVTLQNLLEYPQLSETLAHVIRREVSFNLRQVATIAGTLVAADGRSPLTTALLALDAVLTILPEDERLALGDLLPFRAERLRGRLITQVSIPLQLRLAYQDVARSPSDLPIVCVAVAAWPSGRTRVAIGGYGQSPLMVMDGTEAEGADIAARDACSQAGDEWASAEYRQEVAGVLTRRCIAELASVQS